MAIRYIMKSGPRWKYRFMKNGRSHRGQGFLTETEAKDAEARARLTLSIIATGSLSVVAAQYLDYVERNQTFKTYSQKKSHIAKFITYSGDIPADHLTPHICQKFLDQFPDTASNTHRKTLSAWLKWCLDMRLINTFNPFLVVKPKPKSQFKKYIPPQEHIFRVMLNANPLQRDFIRAIYYSLARRGEIINMLVDDVDFTRHVLTLRTRKRTGEIRERQIRIVQPLINILLPRCEAGNKYVFTSPRTKTKFFDMNTVLPRLCKRLEIKPFTFHAIRHYGSSYLVKQGATVKDIQQLLGHSELRTTEIYLHDLENVAEGLNKLGIDPIEKGLSGQHGGQHAL